MFCPQCGQQQAADDVRFCSRCGFQLGAVAELMKSGAPAPAKRFAGGALDSPRRRGVRQGVLLTLFGVFLVPLLFMLSELTGIKDEIVMLGFLTFLAGVLRCIYAIFEDAAPAPAAAADYAGQPAFARAPGRAPAGLPAARGHDARSYVPPRRDTADIVPPPSVVEGATRRFAEEGEEPR